MNRAERIDKKIQREVEQMVEESKRIVNRLYKLSRPAKGWSLLRVSDEFAAIGRAAERAKWRAYELYMWLGREEIKHQRRPNDE